jgi:hypothetical protein
VQAGGRPRLDSARRGRVGGTGVGGDAVIDGRRGPAGAHAAIVVKRGSTPMGVSNGSEPGPFYLRFNYRSDVLSIGRCI